MHGYQQRANVCCSQGSLIASALVSTVAILAQGTNWADAVTQAYIIFASCMHACTDSQLQTCSVKWRVCHCGQHRLGGSAHRGRTSVHERGCTHDMAVHADSIAMRMRGRMCREDRCACVCAGEYAWGGGTRPGPATWRASAAMSGISGTLCNACGA